MVFLSLTAYITLVCTSAVLNLYLCLKVFLKRHHYTNIAYFFILYTLFITIYCFASAFGLMATTLQEIKFWTIVQYVGLPFSPPLGLLFIMKYLGVGITKGRIAGLVTVSFLSFIMVSTNDFHHLHYRVFELDPVLGAPFVYQEIGLSYMIYGVFIFSCMFVAFFLVLSRWKETTKLYQPQLVALAFGQFVPMFTAFIYLIGLTPPGIDPVPMVLWLTSLLYLWSINSSRMFSIMPIAKDSIFNSINDGVIVLDESRRLIEFNHSSMGMFPQLNKSMIGTNFEKVWLTISGGSFPTKLNVSGLTQEIAIMERIYQVRTSSLQDTDGLLLIFTDITELKSLQTKLEFQAYYDELTRIYNRRAFFENCEQQFGKARSGESPFTVILMDIDYFKKVNDTYGHHIGDLLLKHFVSVCQSQLTEDMLFARYGGEEFVLALEGKSIKEGERLANQLRHSVETQPLITTEAVVRVTLSCGVAELKWGREEELYQLLQKADKALYDAKQEGRNQVRVYSNDA